MYMCLNIMMIYMYVLYRIRENPRLYVYDIMKYVLRNNNKCFLYNNNKTDFIHQVQSPQSLII